MPEKSEFAQPQTKRESDLSPSSRLDSWRKKIAFVLAMWLLSRLLIIVVMQVISPELSSLPYAPEPVIPLGKPPQFIAPTPGWDLFTHWDGKWYEMIATHGYEYGADYETKRYTIGFPPLFALVSFCLMKVSGLPFAISGTVVNNAAFLGALCLIYFWVEEQYGAKIAKWTTVGLAWCPYSLFGTVAYTEGLFLLTTAAALRAFEKRHYFWASFWGALATITRFFATALIPTFLLTAWREKRHKAAYISALAIGIGWLLFLTYSGWKFGEPLAPFKAQAPWTAGQETWRDIIGQLIIRGKFSLDRVIKILMFFGGGLLLWCSRQHFTFLTSAYAFCYIGTLSVSLATYEISRYSYANVALAIVFGFFLARYPKWRFVILSFFLLKMIEITVRFAWWYFPM